MVLPLGRDGPGTWQIWGGRTTGERFLLSWQKPTHSYWVRALPECKETTGVVPAAQWGGSQDHRQRDATPSLSCPRVPPGRCVTPGVGIR